ncbi:hypothetical protein LJY25_10605 [Hymenobacter sp. BT175]|uniref:hypothetical protein n=1 Tax=Hymenobacter translucens TaxID=2886507 RepID=UPI001D0E4CC4|nr:hypothetical protein [Hymenobacter translucens]MCC2546895.1 hypothetical protein [Hymenobacter translucens]
MSALLRYCLFFFSALSACLSAQHARAQVYYLDLGSQQLVLSHQRVHVEQVIDGRPGKPTIGLTHRGLKNRPAAVLFRNGLEAELTSFLHRELPARPTDTALVLCLRQLRISEDVSRPRQEARAELAVDAYLHLPDGYHLVRSAAAHTIRPTFEATGRHAGHLAQLFRQCLEQISASPLTPAPGVVPCTLAQLTGAEPAPGNRFPALPAICREAPRRGVYHSFEQFLANRPDTLLTLRMDTLRLARKRPGRRRWAGVARFQPVLTDAQGRRPRLPEQLWGFSDGQQLFIQHKGAFFPLVRQGRFFTFIGEKPLDLEYVRRRYEAQIRAAAVGLAPVYYQNQTGEPTPYAVDMRTGQSSAFPDLLQPNPARPDTAVVFLYRQGPASAAPVPVYLDGKKVGQLGANQYLQLPWPYYARMMRLCLGNVGDYPCQLLVPDAAKASYLKVTAPVSPGEEAAWQWVGRQQGEADLDALDQSYSAATLGK